MKLRSRVAWLIAVAAVLAAGALVAGPALGAGRPPTHATGTSARHRRTAHARTTRRRHRTTPAVAATPASGGAPVPAAVSTTPAATSTPPAVATVTASPAPPDPAIAAHTAAGHAATQPALSARAAILIERSTGQILYAYRDQAQLPIASTTKLMTALLTLEHVRRLSTIFAAPDYYAAAGDSQIGLVPGERMTVHDLLLALLIPSADDAAEDLAYNIGRRSVARFVGMMNARARELGLTETHYSTPSGLDTPGNYSSARDLVKLAVYLVDHHPFFRHAMSLPSARLRVGRHFLDVVSTNTLLGRVPWINGVKTGHTAAAGYVLVGSGTRGGLTLVSAVLGTASEASRDANSLALLRWGFSNFRLAHPVVAGTVVARPAVADSPGVHVAVLATRSVTEMVARDSRLITRVDVPHQVAGPKRDHAVVGSIVVSSGRRVIARVPVELSRRLPAVSTLTIVGRFLTRPTTLVFLVLLIGAASALAWRRRRGRGRGAGGTRAIAGNGLPAPAAEPVTAASAAAEREARRAEREARRRGDHSASSARDRA